MSTEPLRDEEPPPTGPPPPHTFDPSALFVVLDGLRRVAARGGDLVWCDARVAAAGFYERMGFSEVCEYHYRVSNGPAAPRSGSAAVAGDARPVRPDGS